MENTGMLKTFTRGLQVALAISLVLLLASCGRGKPGRTAAHEKGEEGVAYYTCGMHPSVRVSPEEYAKGNTSCPICHMNLTPVKRMEKNTTEHKGPVVEDTREQEDIRRVSIPVEQLKRAGVRSELVKKRTLCKNIRTVGQVAYDPDLVVAQEELIASLDSLDKMQEGTNLEIVARAKNLVESTKRRLRLLGLNDKQIEEIGKTRNIQKGLIFPEKEMWVYGDIYEYEIGWVNPGNKVTVMAESFPGEKFHGEISAIDPIINPKTRSVKFRAQIDNPDLGLKPQMYVDVTIQGICINKDGDDKVPAVPRDAVIDTGLRKIVWIDMGDGTFEGREVETGMEGVSLIDGDGRRFYPVFKGIKEGEKVVTKGNFLIDSQSQITGVAASAYGGALGDKEKRRAPHQN